MEKLYLLKYDKANNPKHRITDTVEFFGDYEDAERAEVDKHVNGNASYTWRLLTEPEYLTQYVEPSSEFVERFANALDEHFGNGGMRARIETDETRTSYRVSFAYGPLYDRNGYSDGYQGMTVIFHKDRPIPEYSLVYQAPNYKGRKYDLKEDVAEQIGRVLEDVPFAWYWKRSNGDLIRLEVAERSVWNGSDLDGNRVKAWIGLVTPSAFAHVTFERSFQDALDTLADSGCLDVVQADKDDYAEIYADEAYHMDYSLLGNASEPFDLTYCRFFEAEHIGNGILVEK